MLHNPKYDNKTYTAMAIALLPPMPEGALCSLDCSEKTFVDHCVRNSIDMKCGYWIDMPANKFDVYAYRVYVSEREGCLQTWASGKSVYIDMNERVIVPLSKLQPLPYVISPADIASVKLRCVQINRKAMQKEYDRRKKEAKKQMQEKEAELNSHIRYVPGGKCSSK